MKKTHKNNFTAEQVAELRQNPYVARISPSTIRFTEEFKYIFFQRKGAGESAKDIFRDCGFDPDVLGECRVRNFLYLINKQSKKEKGFSDNRQFNCRRPAKPTEQTSDSRLRSLEHEVAYLRQVVEFLKKVREADMEALNQWASQHDQK